MHFVESNLRLRRAAARRYVYRVLSLSLANDLQDKDGWVLGGTNDPPWDMTDRALVIQEARRAMKELVKKGQVGREE